MDELKKFKKEHKLTKKEKERVDMWVGAGHNAYDLEWLDELREEKELDELLRGLTTAQKDYVYSYCMNWNLELDDAYFDYEKVEELDLKNLPIFEEEEALDIDLPF